MEENKTQPSVQIPQPPTGKKGIFVPLWLIILIVVMFPLLVILCTYFVVSSQKVTLNTTSQHNSTEKYSNTPSPIAIQNGGSETTLGQPGEVKNYTNENLGFSFQYPADKVSIAGESTLSISSKYPNPGQTLSLQSPFMTMNIAVAATPTGITIKNALGEGPYLQYDGSLLNNKNDNFNIFKVDGSEAIRADGIPAGQAGSATDVIIIRNGKIYQLTFSPIAADNTKVFDQILSSFRFTK